jgi:hypothetical protein
MLDLSMSLANGWPAYWKAGLGTKPEFLAIAVASLGA